MRQYSSRTLTKCLQKYRPSLSDLAEKAGLTPQYLFKLRNGGSLPSANTLVRLADALELPLDYFFIPTSEERSA